MLDVELGYDPKGLIIMSLLPQLAGPDQRFFVAEALERIKASPGVESAAVMSLDRFGQLNLLFNREDRPFPNGDVMVRYGPVTADYFRVLKSPLIAGRGFESRDSANSPLVAVINEKLAREYFSGEDPIGKKITIAYNNQRLSMEVIGVAGNVRQDSPREPVKPEILVHWPQLPWISANLAIRTSGDWAAASKFVQEAIWSVNRNLPPSRVQTLEQVLSWQVATPRLYMILFTLFSAVALMLAALGIYGLIACVVSRRTNEMAIRVAIGARRGDILGMVIGEGLRLSVAGILLGLACTLALTRLMRSLLFEVSPSDPLTFSGVAILLLGVALAACYIPARRAARTDPTVALRHE
jgi:putative ABC transport system permease protein